MAQTQKTIRFSKENDRLIAEISPNHVEPNYNFGVNQIMQRYSVLCKHLKPEFTAKEWMAIFQAYNEHSFNADIELEAKAFQWQIKEAIQWRGDVRELLGDLIKKDCPAFIEKIESLSIPEIIAVFQEIHSFWMSKTSIK